MTKQRKIRWFFIAAYSAGAILCVVAFAAWFFSPPAAVEREIAKLKARGEPWELTDFVPPKIKPEENAAFFYRQAANDLQVTNRGLEFIFATTNLPMDNKDIERADGILKNNQQVLKLLRQASNMSQVDWDYPIEKVRYSPTATLHLLDHLPVHELHNLTCFSRLAAFRAHEQYNDLETLRHIDSLLQLGRALRKIPDLYMARMANDADYMAIAVVQQTLWNLDISPKMDAEDRLLAMRLIHKLTDDRELNADYRRQHFGERTVKYYLVNKMLAVDCKAKGVYPARVKLWINVSDAAHTNHYPEVLRIPEIDPDKEPISNGVVLTSDEIREWVQFERRQDNGRFLIHFRLLADRRMAGVALAIRLYVLDHGKRPADLTELVDKNYIESVPDDPLTEKSPIRYIAEGPHPRLYSVGCNGTDDGGSLEMPEEYKPYFMRSRTLDTPFFLDRPIKEVEPPFTGGYGGGYGYGYGGPAPTTLPESAASQPK